MKHTVSLYLDIDECSTGSHTCHANATCTDTIDSYTCTCFACFTGNGTYCEGKEETDPKFDHYLFQLLVPGQCDSTTPERGGGKVEDFASGPQLKRGDQSNDGLKLA